MATYAEIFNFDDNIVSALVAAFNADSVLTGNLAYGPRENEALPKTRIDVVALGFSKASEQQVYAQSRYWDAHYSGSVVVTIINPRADATARAAHATRVGRVRYLMTPKAQILTSSNLPSYEVLSLEQTGATAAEKSDDDTDRTELTFELHFALLASALSAAT